jgi:hypothetical protein
MSASLRTVRIVRSQDAPSESSNTRGKVGQDPTCEVLVTASSLEDVPVAGSLLRKPLAINIALISNVLQFSLDLSGIQS